MAKDNKVVTYRTGDGRSVMACATDKQIKALREANRLEEVRRVRLRGQR